MEALKPCPFCGSTDVRVIDDDGYWHVECAECPVMTRADTFPAAVIEDWNLRADLAGLPEELVERAHNAIKAWDDINDRYTQLDLASALSEILRWHEQQKGEKG